MTLHKHPIIQGVILSHRLYVQGIRSVATDLKYIAVHWIDSENFLTFNREKSPQSRTQILADLNVIRKWNVITGEQVWSPRMCTRANFVAFSPDGQLLATCWFHTVRIFILDKRKARRNRRSVNEQYLANIRTCYDPHSLIWSNDSQNLTIYDSGGEVTKWSRANNHVTYKYGKLHERFESVIPSPNGSQLMCRGDWADPDSITIEMYDALNHRSICSSVNTDYGNNSIVTWSPDGNHQVWGYYSNSFGVRIRWRDILGREGIRELVACTPNMKYKDTTLTRLVFSPNGQFLACGMECGNIIIWNVNNEKVIHHASPAESHNIRMLSWSPNGQRLIWYLDTIHVLEMSLIK
jgi:WD40 repeat protein